MPDVNVGGIYADASINTAKWDSSLKQMSTNVNTAMSKTSGVTKKLGDNIDKNINKPLKETSKRIWNVYTNFKDIGRVATGILMARAINSMLRGLFSMVNALKEFNSLLEVTQVSFKYLLGSMEAAKNMISDIEEIAARTPFTFETATEAAQRLLALGFNERQIHPMLEMMADLATATGGGADQMNALAYAFGKVQAQGKLTRKELKLFVTAHLPIYDILKKELGLTREMFEKKMSIPSETILPAILKYIAKFQGAAKEAEKTIPGLISSIHDYALFLGQDLLGKFWESVRGVLTGIRDTLAKLRKAIQEEGIYGFLTVLFPPEMRQSIVIFIRGIQELGKSVWGLLKSLGPLIGVILELATVILAFLTPPLIALIRIITDIITRGMNIINVFITWASANILLASTLNNLLQKMVNFLGLGGDVIRTTSGWMMAQKGVNDELQKPPLLFNDLINSLSDLGDEAEETADKFKPFLAAFDEVYNLPEPTGGLANLADLIFPKIEIPDLSPLIDDVKDVNTSLEDLYNKFPQWLKNLGQWIWDVLVQGLIRAMMNMYNSIVMWLNKIANKIMDIFVTQPLAWFGRLLDAWNELWMRIYNNLVGWLQKIGDKLYDIFVTKPLQWGAKLFDLPAKYFAWFDEHITQAFIQWNMKFADSVFEFIRNMQKAWDSMKVWIIGIWNNIKLWATTTWITVRTAFMSIWTGVMSAIQNTWTNVVNGMIKGLNIIIGMLNAINPFRDIPTINMVRPAGATAGATRGWATGGIINKEQIGRLGEGGVKETVTPLTTAGVQPWANAIVNAMQGLQTSSNISSEYVLVPMKKTDYVNLARQLFIAQKSESFRIAGRKV